MPSFDIVSNVNSMEIENAVNQAKKELANRFDFKNTKADIALEKNEIKLSAEDQFKIQALTEIVMGKLAKRSISLKSVDKGAPDVSPLGHARQVIKIKQGLDQPSPNKSPASSANANSKSPPRSRAKKSGSPPKAGMNSRPLSLLSAPANFPPPSNLLTSVSEHSRAWGV